jgi:hypothetical protein
MVEKASGQVMPLLHVDVVALLVHWRVGNFSTAPPHDGPPQVIVSDDLPSLHTAWTPVADVVTWSPMMKGAPVGAWCGRLREPRRLTLSYIDLVRLLLLFLDLNFKCLPTNPRVPQLRN